MKRLLFVCTGNICRSPMAEGIARARLGDADVEVASAGTHALVGRSAEPSAVVAASEVGASLTQHQGAQLDTALLRDHDHVYVMTRDQLEGIRAQFGDDAANVEMLDPDGGDIADPYRQPPAAYRRVRDRIVESIEARLDDWQA